MVLLCYLSVALPLRACFTVDIEPGDKAFWFEVFVDLVFITDLIFNFRTAYMTPAGVSPLRNPLLCLWCVPALEWSSLTDCVRLQVLEERPRKIAKHYFQGWFAFDFLSCMPFQHIAQGGSGVSSQAVCLPSFLCCVLPHVLSLLYLAVNRFSLVELVGTVKP